MMNKPLIAAAVLVLLGASLTAQQYFESRNNAMGGVGVASSKYLAAGFANPALLTQVGEGDRFGLLLPLVGIMASDRDGLVDAIEDLKDSHDRLEELLDSGTATIAELNAQRLIVTDQLLALDGKTAIANVGTGFGFAIPGKSLGFALVVKSYLDLDIAVDIDPADAGRITAAAVSGDLTSLQSKGIVYAAAVTEVGIALAHEFDLFGMPFSVGLTPKAQRVDTFNYSVNVSTFEEDDFDEDNLSNDTTKFNLDLGLALKPSDSLTVGLMTANLLDESFDTVETNLQSFTYHLKPKTTVGVAYSNPFMTLAADLDLMRDKRFNRDDDTRLVRAGVEFDAWQWLQLRAGIRHDLEDNMEDMLTGGIGISPFDIFHIDVTGMIGEGDTYGAVIQTYLTF